MHPFSFAGIYTPLYSVSLFLPTIILEMGYKDPNHAQLMSVPPYVAGCIATIAGGWLADRAQMRGPFMMFFCAVAIVGFIMLIATDRTAVQYVGTFLTVCG